MSLLVTLLIGLLGAYVGYKMRIPAGSLIGALISTVILSIISDIAVSLQIYKIAAQTIAGIFIGMQLDSVDTKLLKTLWKSVLTTAIGMLFINAVAGAAVYLSSSLDAKTALFSATPGGIAEMALMSGEQGANTLQVTILQLFRMLFALLVFPACAQHMIWRDKAQGEQPSATKVGSVQNIATLSTTMLVIVVSSVAGYWGYTTHIAGMNLVFPMLTTALLGLIKIHAKLSSTVKRAAQALSGISIGCTASISDVSRLPDLIIPLISLLFVYLVLSLLLGKILHCFCNLQSDTAYFACIPAGVSDIALIASDYGSGGPVVALLQLVRYTMVVVCSPLLITQLAPLLSGL